MGKIISHRPRRSGYQFCTHLEATEEHEAEWKSTRDFIYPDVTITLALLEYLKDHKLLPDLVAQGEAKTDLKEQPFAQKPRRCPEVILEGGGNSATTRHSQ